LFAAAGRGSIWHNANAVGTSFGVVGAFPPLFVGVPSFPIHRVVCGGAVDHFLLVKRSIHDGKRFGPMCWPGFVPPWQWLEAHWWHLVALVALVALDILTCEKINFVFLGDKK
jgi:hypothetical protein